MKIIIIGSGVIGVTSAYYLAKFGHEVTVIDKEEKSGMATSFANGGQLSYSHVDPLATPSIFAKLPKLALGLDPSFRMKLSANPDFIKWVTMFLRNCTGTKDLYNTENVLRLALHSQEQLFKLRQEIELDFDFRQGGKLICYSNANDKRLVQNKLNFKRKLGGDQWMLSHSECLDLEPSLVGMSDLSFGVFSKKDESGDALQFSQALEKYCERELGVKFLFNRSVDRLVYTEGKVSAVMLEDEYIEADAFVMAAGNYSKRLCKPLKVNLPICPLKGYSITVPATKSTPDISLTDMKNKVVYCKLGDRFRIAGIAELGNSDLSVSEKHINSILTIAKRTLPDAGDYTQLLTSWSGLRPATPDSAPIIGETPVSNLFCNTGHGMLGWTLACGSSSLLAEVISGRKVSTSLAGLNYSRF